MNKRGILFVSILLILVSSAYALDDCFSKCVDEGYERGECLDSDPGSGWDLFGSGPCRGISSSLECYCKKTETTQSTPPALTSDTITNIVLEDLEGTKFAKGKGSIGNWHPTNYAIKTPADSYIYKIGAGSDDNSYYLKAYYREIKSDGTLGNEQTSISSGGASEEATIKAPPNSIITGWRWRADTGSKSTSLWWKKLNNPEDNGNVGGSSRWSVSIPTDKKYALTGIGFGLNDDGDVSGLEIYYRSLKTASPALPPQLTYTPSDPFDVPTGSSGDTICQSQGGFCVKTECRVPLLPVWTEYFCRAQDYDCSTVSTKDYGWIKAYCSCTDTGRFCKQGMVYEKKNTCQEFLVENCPAKDMKCSGGECAGCIDSFVMKDGKCISCESIGGTWDSIKKKCNYCDLPIPSGDDKKIKKGVPTQDSQGWVYDNTESKSCSWNCSSGYTLAGTTCVVASPPQGCTEVRCTTSDSCIGKQRCVNGVLSAECTKDNPACPTPTNVEIKSIDSDPKTIGYVNQKFRVICESSIPNVNFIEAFVYSYQTNKLDSQCVFVEGSWDNSKANFTCSSSDAGQIKTLKCTINEGKVASQNYKKSGSDKTKQITIINPPAQTKCGTAQEVCNKLSTQSCTSIASDLYSGGDANCKEDCSGWNTANCVSKTTIGCGNDVLDAGETCDKQLTPTQSCISINSDLYSGGEATCKEDCSGWDRTKCVLKTGECQAGTTKCLDGVCRADCGGNELPCNSDGICATTESCTCSDCYEKRDSCQEGLVCDASTEQCKQDVTTGCGNGIVEPNLGEQCDCETDNACTLTELGLQGDSCLSYYNAKSYSSENRPYPNKKVSCFPSTSSNELKCQWNAQGCNSGYDVCLKDTDCPSGNYCDLSVDYCKQKCTQDEQCIMDGCTGKKICNTQTGILSNTCTKDNPACGVAYQCIGNAPANAQLCEGDSTGLTSETQTSLVQACTSAKCEYTCEQGYSLQGGQCVQQALIPCGEGQIPATGCQCPAGAQKFSGYCCRNAQNDLVYSPDVPCDQEGLKTEGKTLASFKYDKKGIIVNFISTSIPSQGTVINYYEWDFDDSSTRIGGQEYKEITHTYQFDESEKTFLVSLLVHDNKAGVDKWSMSIKIEKSISDLPDTETCNVRGKSLALCHNQLDGCFLDSGCESCRVVSECDDFSNDELACTGKIPGCNRYACDWDNGNVCLPKQVSEQDCQYVCIDLAQYPNYYFNGKKEYSQTCETGTCWECPAEGCKFISSNGEVEVTYIDGECVGGFKEVTKIEKAKSVGTETKTILPPQPCSISPVISFFTLFNIILTLSILTVFYVFRKKF